MNDKKCIVCGATLDYSDGRCRSCGALIEKENPAVKKSKCHKKLFENAKAAFIVKNALTLVLSLILLISAFLPIYNITLDISELTQNTISRGEIKIEITAIDAVVFWLDSFTALDAEELNDSELYEEIELLTEELTHNIYNSAENTQKIKLTENQEKELSKILKKYMHLIMQSEETTTAGYMTSAVIMTFIHIGLCIALFVVALVGFVKLSLGKKALFFPCLRIMLFVPISAVLLCFNISSYGGICRFRHGGLSAAIILSIVLPIIFAAYLLVDRLIHLKRASVSSIVKNTVSLVCSIVVIGMIFAPIISTEITHTFRESEKERTLAINIDNTYFTYIDKDNDSVLFDEISIEYATNAFEEYSDYSRREITDGMADLYNVEFLTHLLSSVIEIDLLKLFTSINYFLMLVGIFAGSVAVQNLLYLSTGEKIRWLTVASKILCTVAAIAVLTVTILFLLLVSYTINEFTLIGYAASISYGPIAMLIFALVTLCIPSKDNNSAIAIVESEEKDLEVQPVPISE